MVHLSLLADEIIKPKTGPKEKQQCVPAAGASYLLHHTCSNPISLFPDFDLVCPPEFHTFGSVKVIEMVCADVRNPESKSQMRPLPVVLLVSGSASPQMIVFPVTRLRQVGQKFV